jgi:DNA-binding XRE family transcriptional regulator
MPNTLSHDDTFSTGLVRLIRGLPREDLVDVLELFKALSEAETDEEQSIVRAILEILDPPPMWVSRQELTESTGPELQSWIAYVSKRIRETRKAGGLTQQQLAERSGIPQSHISRLEAGKHSPSGLTLRKLAKALGVAVQVFDPSA